MILHRLVLSFLHVVKVSRDVFFGSRDDVVEDFTWWYRILKDLAAVIKVVACSTLEPVVVVYGSCAGQEQRVVFCFVPLPRKRPLYVYVYSHDTSREDEA